MPTEAAELAFLLVEDEVDELGSDRIRESADDVTEPAQRRAPSLETLLLLSRLHEHVRATAGRRG